MKGLSTRHPLVGAAAATATAAAIIGQLSVGRDTADFERGGDVLRDRALERLQLALGVEEGAGDLIAEKFIAGGLELLDFGRSQLDPGVLLLVEFLAALVDRLVHEAGTVVFEETLHILLELRETGVRSDRGTEFAGFLEDWRGLGKQSHGIPLDPLGQTGKRDLAKSLAVVRNFDSRR